MGLQEEAVLKLAQEQSLLRPRDLEGHGLPRVALTRLVRERKLQRVGRGLYALPKRVPSEHAGIAKLARKHPQGIVCLLSALRLHGLTTQAPFEVWWAIPHKAAVPQCSWPPLRIVRFSGPALNEGLEQRLLDGVLVQVTDPAKTVADCFKFRNKIGLDVALEALHEAWKEKRVTMDELWKAALVCRVTQVMQPYLEVLP